MSILCRPNVYAAAKPPVPFPPCLPPPFPPSQPGRRPSIMKPRRRRCSPPPPSSRGGGGGGAAAATEKKSHSLYSTNKGRYICVGDGYHPWQDSNPEPLGSETAYDATTLPGRRRRRSTRASRPMEPRRSHGPGSAGRYPRAAQPRPAHAAAARSSEGWPTSHGEPGRSRGRRLRPSSNGGDCGGAVVPLKNIKRFCVVQMSTRLRSPLFPSLPVYLPFTTGPPPIHYGSESGR